MDDLIAQFQAQQDRANAANEQRFQQGLELFDRIIQQQETGDVSEQAIEAAIGRGRTQTVAQGTQALVSSGLASTTQAAGLGKKFEEEVGVPARLRAADIRQQRLNQALRDKAGFIERREDIGPDFATVAGLARSIGAGQQASTAVSGNRRSSVFGGTTGRRIPLASLQGGLGEQFARRGQRTGFGNPPSFATRGTTSRRPAQEIRTAPAGVDKKTFPTFSRLGMTMFA